MNQTTLSELVSQHLTESDIEEFVRNPEEMSQALFELACQHLSLCEKCRDRLLVHQPQDAMEQQLSYS